MPSDWSTGEDIALYYPGRWLQEMHKMGRKRLALRDNLQVGVVVRMTEAILPGEYTLNVFLR